MTRNKPILNTKYQPAFTIVELLIVIIVIAILAAISVVAYTGIQNRAHDSIVQSDLSQAYRQQTIAATLDELPIPPGWSGTSYITANYGSEEAALQAFYADFATFTNLTHSSYNTDEAYNAVAVYRMGYWDGTSWKDSPGYDFAAISKSSKVFIATRDSGGVVRGMSNNQDVIEYLQEEIAGIEWWLATDDLSPEEAIEREQYRAEAEAYLADLRNQLAEAQQNNQDIWYVTYGGCSTTSIIGTSSALLAYSSTENQWRIDPYSSDC